MTPNRLHHVYGPVPSRRLGRSLGVDLVPFKTCTYDCVYCQLGRTTRLTLERQPYVPVDALLAEIKASLASGSAPDYIGLAGSGEPTLHSGIGELIQGIKAITSIPIAVLTNGSLLWMPEVRHALMQADLVLPSLDAGDPETFQKVNRPQDQLCFAQIAEGLAIFTRDFPGEVWLEVFLLAGINDNPASIANLADLARKIRPARVQLNTVTRPPVESLARALAPERLQELLSAFPGRVEIICDGAAEAIPTETLRIEDAQILALLGRRPCTPRDVACGLGLHELETLKHLDRLVAAGTVGIVETGGRSYYTLATPISGGQA
ncbi:MAG: radical SAM protein [Holophaga sp.]|nr:radical SAM protein [Holophaga sp.]